MPYCGEILKEYIKREIRKSKYIHMGYANCHNLKCNYCGNIVPTEVYNAIMKEYNK